MAAKVKVLQKSGVDRLDKQVQNAILNGWAVYGSPFLLNGLPSQVVVYTGVKSETARYQAAMKDGLLSMEAQVGAMLDTGWSMYMEPLEFGGQPVQVMVKGDIQIMPMHGAVDGEVVTPPTITLPSWRVEVITNLSLYPLHTRDHLKHLVLSNQGDVTLSLGQMSEFSMDAPFRCLVTNAGGTITLKMADSALVSPSKVIAKGGTVALTAANAMWIGTGDWDLNYWGA